MRPTLIALVLAFACACAAASAAAAAAAAAAPDPAAGAIYGAVTDRDGRTVHGFLRFDGWDTWWDDAFTADREGSPWNDLIGDDILKDLAKERRAAYFATHGLIDRLAYALHGNEQADLSRQLVCRYGQVARITQDRDEAWVEIVDGTRHAVAPGHRDLDGELTVATAGGDSTVLDLGEVRELVFSQAPAGVLPPWRRLTGTVTTTRGPLSGAIQWDRSENCDLDALDGEDSEGDHDVPMGTIAAIAKGTGGSVVELRDGTTLTLDGTNDVNRENRGIVVAVDGVGRVIVPWKHFEKVEFADLGPSGPARADFGPAAELAGTVTDLRGAALDGRIVHDLDEGWTWDLLDGEADGWDYIVPFGLIAALEPGADGCLVVLRSGESLTLVEGNDVDSDNAGVLVLRAGAAVRVPWAQAATIRFAP